MSGKAARTRLKNPAATQHQSTERQRPMPALETRTEHENAAAAAVKARAALTSRSTSGAQAHYDELRQKGRSSVPARA
jgi:hypothetical protein